MLDSTASSNKPRASPPQSLCSAVPSTRGALPWLFPRPGPSGFSLERPPLTPPAKVPPSWSPVLKLLHRTYLSIYFLKIFGRPRSSLAHAGFLELQQEGTTFVAVLGLLVVASHGAQATVLAEALLPRGMRDLSGPGIEPMSPALADGFLTTGPPGKSLGCFFNCFIAGFPKLHVSSLRAGTSLSLSLDARGHILGRRISESRATIQETHSFLPQVCPKHPL